jgi:phosphoenolpyruvate-protein kinase (PTS system EI component)
VLPLLLGVGLTTLSVAPTRVDDVRVSVRSTDVRAARARVVDVLSGAPAGLVRAGVSDA